MTKINDGGPAFPQVNETSGMSVRDYFAAHVASGMAAYSGTAGISYSPHNIAGRAYEVADALLAARAPLPAPPHGEEG